MMPPNTGSTVIVFLISNSLFSQRKKTENKYIECSKTTFCFSFPEEERFRSKAASGVGILLRRP